MNGTMAAAKIKNVHPPALNGKNKTPSNNMPPTWIHGRRLLQQKDSPVEDEKDRGSKDVEEPLLAADVF